MGFFNKWKKKRERYYNEKLRQYEEINKKFSLGLAFEDYQPIAWAYADQKAKSERGWLESIFSGGNIFKVLINVVVAVASVAVSVVSGGSLTTISIAIISNVLNVINKISMLNVIDKAVFLGPVSNMLQSALNSLENLEKAQRNKDQLTHLIVYEPYAILANGDIYHAQKPGSESYSPSIAFDPNKGILGEFKSDEIDEVLQNRAQVKGAGNIEFFENIFNTHTPQSTFNFSTQAKNDSLENNARIANKRITEGFNELCVLYFNILGTAQSLYQKVLDKQVKPYYQKIVNNDFLEKNTHYSKGLRADFNYQKIGDFFKSGGGNSKDEITLDELFAKWEKLQNSDFLTCYQKAEEYSKSIFFVYDKLDSFVNVDVLFYPMRTPLNTSTNINLGMGSFKYVNNLKRIMPQARELYVKYIRSKTHKEAKALHQAYAPLEAQIWENVEELEKIRRMHFQNFGWHFPLVPFTMELKAHGVLTRDRRQAMIGPNRFQKIEPKKVKFSNIFNLKAQKNDTLKDKIEFYERRFKLRAWSRKAPNAFGREEDYYYLILDLIIGNGADYYHGFLPIDAKTYDLFRRVIPKNPCIDEIDLSIEPKETQDDIA